jgi:hypothetical protein
MEDDQLGFLRLEDAVSDERAVLVNATHPDGVRTADGLGVWLGWMASHNVDKAIHAGPGRGGLSGLFMATPSRKMSVGRGVHGNTLCLIERLWN